MDKSIAEKILKAMAIQEASWNTTTYRYESDSWYRIAQESFTEEEEKSGFGQMFIIFGWDSWNNVTEICYNILGIEESVGNE